MRSPELSLARRLGYRRGVGLVRAFQGLMFLERGMLPLAVGVLEEAWLIFDSVGDRVGAEFAGARLGLSLATSGRSRKAEQIVRASLSLVQSAEQGIAMSAGYDALGVVPGLRSIRAPVRFLFPAFFGDGGRHAGALSLSGFETG